MTGKTIMIASSKGGVGKSTAALGISRALARAGFRVLLADMDLGNACLDILLGVQDSVLCTLQDAVCGRCAPADPLIKIEDGVQNKKRKKKKDAFPEGGLWLLPSAVGEEGILPTELMGESGAFRSVLSGAAESVGADYILLDTGAGINDAVAAAAGISDAALVVTGQMPVALRSAEKTVTRLSALGVRDICIVINSFDANGVIAESRRGLFAVIDESRARLLGVIPYDYGLMLTHEQLRSFGKDSETAFSNIARRLRGESVPLFDKIKKLRKLKDKLCI